MKGTIKISLVAVMGLAASAWAGEVSVGAPSAPTPGQKLVLSCPSGTKQMGGVDTALEATLCGKVDKKGNRIFHGPYVVQYANGQLRAKGQYVDNFRSGLWTFYDESGVMTGQTEFVRGDYHGMRVEFFPNGQKKLEENWVAGKRQGPVKSWDAKGQATVVEYKDDKPVAAR